MIQIIASSLIAFGITVAGLFGIYNYAPFSLFETNSGKLGATITTINGSDTISSSRTVINDNFTALNNGKIEVGSTTINALVSAPNLATVGTITTGTWSADAIAVAKGGSGTTSPSTYQVVLGNGANGFTVASGTGSTGQFLTSNGAGAYPSWQSATVNQTDSYNFTGTNFLVKNLSASSTSANPIKLNGVSYNTPSTQGASSTILMNDASGNLKWFPESWTLLARSSFASASTNTINFSPRLNLKVIIYNPGMASAVDERIYFNSDITSTNYGAMHFLNNVFSGSCAGPADQNVGCNFMQSTTTPSYIVMDIQNATSTRKLANIRQSYSNSGKNPSGIGEAEYIWNNTTEQINKIDFTYRPSDVATGHNTGMTVEIYGSNQ